MAAQLSHLAGLARLPNITIQVVPEVAHAGVLGGFAVAERAPTLRPPWPARYSRTPISSQG